MDDLIITHYYSPKVSALNSATATPEMEKLELVAFLSTLKGIGFNRYRKADFYLRLRTRTEEWLYCEFIKCGGIPQTKTPIYFVLGFSSYLSGWFGEDTAYIQIPLKNIASKEISFTLKDSMLTYIGKQNGTAPKPYLFTKEMLQEHLQPDINKNVEKYTQGQYYIEVQVWNASYFKT